MFLDLVTSSTTTPAKVASLSEADQAELARRIEHFGEHAVAEQAGLARQTIARAVAGLRLYTAARQALRAYLAP